MITFDKAETLDLTPELVAMMVDPGKRLPNERPPQARRLDYLDSLVEVGQFLTCEWSIGVGPDGNTYRFNGQHSSLMLAKRIAEMRNLPAVKVILHHWKFTDFTTDVPVIFNSFDNPRSLRTNGDFLEVLRPSVPLVAEVASKRLRRIIAAIGDYIRALPTAEREALPFRPIEARTAVLYFQDPQLAAFANYVQSLAEVRYNNLLSETWLLAQMLEDWRAGPELCQELWTETLSGSGDNDSETRALADELNNAVARKPKLDTDKLHKMMRKYARRWRNERAQRMQRAQAQRDAA